MLGFVRAYAPKRAVVIAPGFSGYLHALHSISCEICYFYAKEEQAFLLDDTLLSFLEEKQPELVILTNPNNPNGALASLNYLKKVSRCCANIGARLLVDECFIALTKEGDGASFFIKQQARRIDELERANAELERANAELRGQIAATT